MVELGEPMKLSEFPPAKILPLLCIVGVMAIVACSAQPTSVPPTVAPPAPTATIPAPPIAPTSVPFAAIDASAQAASLGRGVNFGNALEAPSEGAWGLTLQENYFDVVKQAGFKTIRLPVKFSGHADVNAPYTIDETFFQRVDWAIGNANERGLNLIVDMHNYDELMTDTQHQTARFVALWKQIAERYKDQPATVMFELLNEPHQMTDTGWNKIVPQVLSVVRASNPTRNIIIGGTDYSSVNGLMTLALPPGDPHLIATFHYYSPLEFTHQGAEWVSGSSAWLGTKWMGTSNDKSFLSFDFDRAAKWGKDNQRPVFLGEFGAYDKADPDSRVRWTTFIARQAENRQINWAYWEFGTDFGVYDLLNDRWHKPLLKALMP